MYLQNKYFDFTPKLALFLLVLLCALWSNNSAADSLLTAGTKNYCVDTDGYKVYLKKCNDDKATQKWRYTFSGEMRNGKYRNECLDIKGGKLKKSKKVILYPCHGKKNQTWKVGGKKLKIGKYCLDVPASKYSNGRRLIIYKCTDNANQKFGTNPFRNMVIEHQSIRTVNKTLCVDTDGYNVTVEKCNKNSKSQMWARTLRWKNTVGISTSKNKGEIRNVMHPTKCLDIKGGKLKKGSRVILYRCHRGKNQIWKLKKESIRIKRNVAKHYCLDIQGGDIKAGKKLIIWRCHKKDNQKFVTGPLLKGLTPTVAAEMGFPQFKKCKELVQSEQCYLGTKIVVPLDKSSFRYGFRTGSWPHLANTNYTLDFGEQYSVDRCAFAHDNHQWNTGNDSCSNDIGFLNCLDRVRPSTGSEALARLEAKLYFKTVVKKCDVDNPPDGTLPENR